MRIRLLLAVSALLCASLPGGIAAPSVACAAEQSAVLVVATGGTTYRYCVALPGSSVSGLDLIRLAGEQHGLQYSLGYGGRAVCQLAGVGPDGDDCFADHPNFWGYWRGDGSGGWSWSSTGAGSTTVRSGDVEGWAWGSGQDGDSHPQPPATTYSSVCTSSSDGDGSAGSGGSGGSGSGGAKNKPGKTAKAQPTAPPPGTTEGSAEADSSGDVTEGVVENDDGDRNKRQKKSKKDDDGETGAAVEPDATAANEDRDDRDPAEPALAAEEGPPAAGLIGLGLAVLFGVFGAMLAARRRRRG